MQIQPKTSKNQQNFASSTPEQPSTSSDASSADSNQKNQVTNQNTHQKDVTFQDLKSLSQSIPRAVCGAILKNSLSVHCDTCSKDHDSIFCLDCFEQDKHFGHSYQFKTAHGMCDCGFRYIVSDKSFCKKHYGSHIMKQLDSYKQQIDLQNCAAYVFLMFGGFLLKVQEYYSLLQQNSQIINKDQLVFLTKQIGQFFYQYPIDPIRRIITNMLFMSLSQITSIGCLLEEKEIDQMICPFVDIDKMVHDFQSNESIDQYPIIAILSHLERIFNYESIDFVEQMTHYLVDDQISEPTYRVLFMYFFYLRNKDLSVQYEKFNGDNNQIFAAAQVQLCPNIHMTRSSIILFSCTELCSYYNAFCSKANIKHDHFMQYFDTSYIVEQCSLGLLQIKNICNNDEFAYCFKLLRETVSQFKDLIEIEASQKNLYYFNSMKYVILPEIYAYRNVLYATSQYSNILITFLLLLVQYGSSFISVNRIRDCSDSNNGQNICNFLSLLINDNIYFNKFSWGAYISAFKGLEFQKQTINYSSEILHVNDIFSLEDLTIAPNNSVIICNILSVAVYFILTQSLLNSNCYVFSAYNKYPDIPCRHGFHVFKPFIDSDVNTRTGVNHQIYCSYIVYLSLILNCQNECYRLKKSSQQSTELLKHYLNRIVFCQQLPKYNISILSAFCIRSLVTYGLVQMNGFIKLGQCNEKVKSMYNNEGSDGFIMQIYHYFYVLQQIIQIIPTEKFLFQFFEAYGFADPETGEFVDRFQKTDPEQNDKMLKLLQVMVVHLSDICMNNLSFQDPSSYITKHVLQVFLLIKNPTKLQIQQQLSQMPFYDVQVLDNILDANATKVNVDQSIPEAYQSKQCASFYQLNPKAIQNVSLFDPFLAFTPQFLFHYEQYCLQAKMKQIVPNDCLKTPYLNSLYADLSKSSLVKNSICYILKQYLNNTKATNQQDYDILVVFILFVNIYRYLFNLKIIENSQNSDMQILMQQFIQMKKDGKLNKILSVTIDNMVLNQKQFKQKQIDIIGKFKLLTVQKEQKKSHLMISDLAERVSQETSTSSTELDCNFIQQLQFIEKYGTYCNICCSYENSSYLSQYCTFQIENIIGSQHQVFLNVPQFNQQDQCLNQYILADSKQHSKLFIFHTCSHLVHENCDQKHSQLCPICRSNYTMTVPVVEKQEFSILNLVNLLLKLNDNIDSSIFDILHLVCYGQSAHLVLFEQLQNDQLSLTCSEIYSNYIQNLINFFMSCAELNIQQFSMKSSYDVYSNKNQKQRMYRDLVSIISSICLVSVSLFNFLISKFDTTKMMENFCNCDLQCLKFKKLILLNQKFDPHCEQEQCQIHIKQLLDTTLFDKNSLLELKEKHEQNCSKLLMCEEYRYLLSEELQQVDSFYQALRISHRNEYLCFITNPFNSEDANIFVSWPYKLNLQMYFAKDYIGLVQQNRKMKCGCGKQQNIICLYCGKHYCYKCFTIDLIKSHAESCETDGVWFCYMKNAMFFVQQDGKIYLTGAPYLDDDRNDDCLRLKNATLYLNGPLLNELQRTMLWKLGYKMSTEMQVAGHDPKERIMYYMKSWFGTYETDEKTM